jgi:hypothetical protein
MKIQSDFISNSSCASFIIPKKVLTQEQINKIYNHIDIANSWIIKRDPKVEYTDWWQINEDDENINGDTTMDNFDMMWFLLQIGIDEEHIHYEGCYGT